jgi:cytochrome c peroxidase
MGTNGRSCHHCHSSANGWTLSPNEARARFAINDSDPLFSDNDGAVTPNADVSTTEARRAAAALVLAKGLIRVGLPIPDGAEFELAAVDDPYGYASAKELSLFRRPLPARNLTFLTTVMWDGRRTGCGQSISQDLEDQATHAILTHMKAKAPPSADLLARIVGMERSLYYAQSYDDQAGALDAEGALGGSVNLSKQSFAFGATSADGRAFTLYDAWRNTATTTPGGVARAAVARGQETFNANCTACHDAPNAGSNAVGAYFDLGIAEGSRRTADLPLYTFKNRVTGETRSLTDPGRGLITGRWADLGRFKVPTMRGLAVRAPYFHDGSAPDLPTAIDTVTAKLGLGLTVDEKADLAAFLRAL